MTTTEEPGQEPDKTRTAQLPGILAIAAFMCLMSVVTFFTAMRNEPPGVAAKAMLFCFSAFFAVAGLGLVQLKRWGWAMTLASCFLAMSRNLYFFTRTHEGGLLIVGAAFLVFFLYLVRQDVRGRLR